MNQQRRSCSGFTLIEVIVALGLTILIFSMVARLVPRSTQAMRTSTLAATTNSSLTRTEQQLSLDIGGGQNILEQASVSRLDLLKLQRITALPSIAALSGPTILNVRTPDTSLTSLAGKDVIIANSTGDYLMTTLNAVQALGSGQYQLTLQCPVYLPGNLDLYRFTRLSLAYGAATGAAGGKTLFRRVETRPNDVGAADWVGLSNSLESVTFAPVYGTVPGQFGTNLSAPPQQQGGQALSAINMALTALGEHQETAYGSVQLNALARRPWACGDAPGHVPNNLGKLQVNVLIDGQRSGPAGFNPAVTVGGPAFNQTLSSLGITTYDHLAPGLYNVTAPSVTYAGGQIYDAVISGAPASIGNGRAGTVNVNYRLRQGTLSVTVQGLPTATNATVTITGASTTSATVQNGTSILNLLPGDYRLTSSDVTDSAGNLYKATITPPDFKIMSGTTTNVDVSFWKVTPADVPRDPPNVILKPNQAVLLLTNNNSVNSVFLKLNMYSVNSGKLVNLGSTLIYTGTPYIIDTAYAYSVSSEGLQTQDLECGNEAGCGGGVKVGQTTGSIYDTVASAVVIDTLFSGTSDPTLFALGGGTIAKYKPGGFNYFDVLQCRTRRYSPSTCS